MNPEELKYYIALQSLFKGEWQVGDWFALIGRAWSACVMDQDDTILLDCFGNGFSKDSVIRLPLPIDPRNPERGLMGMFGADDRISLYQIDSYRWVCKVNVALNYFEAETPTLALLKALAYQEGIEV